MFVKYFNMKESYFVIEKYFAKRKHEFCDKVGNTTKNFQDPCSYCGTQRYEFSMQNFFVNTYCNIASCENTFSG